ncbi:phosphatidylserine synthase domain protein, partial [Vibrio parahaemolyticus V-223/04]
DALPKQMRRTLQLANFQCTYGSMKTTAST